LRQKYVAASLVVFRLVVLYPKYLSSRPAGERRVSGYLDELFSSQKLIHLVYFICGSLVAPDYRTPYHLVLLVEHYKAVHLSRKSYALYVLFVDSAYCHYSLDGVDDCVGPVLRVLLGIAVLRLIHGVLDSL